MEINGHDVVALKNRYMSNNSLAIQLYSRTIGLYATLTLNLPESDDLEYGYAFVDVDSCPWAKEFIKKYELGYFATKYASNGWGTYPLYKFDVNKLEDYYDSARITFDEEN